MKVYNTNKELVNAYFNSKSENGRNRNRSLFFDKNTVYSYSREFPLAIRIDKGYLVSMRNGTSKTTATHINQVSRMIPENQYLYVASYIIENMGIIPGKILYKPYGNKQCPRMAMITNKSLEILDYRKSPKTFLFKSVTQIEKNNQDLTVQEFLNPDVSQRERYFLWYEYPHSIIELETSSEETIETIITAEDKIKPEEIKRMDTNGILNIIQYDHYYFIEIDQNLAKSKIVKESIKINEILPTTNSKFFEEFTIIKDQYKFFPIAANLPKIWSDPIAKQIGKDQYGNIYVKGSVRHICKLPEKWHLFYDSNYRFNWNRTIFN